MFVYRIDCCVRDPKNDKEVVSYFNIEEYSMVNQTIYLRKSGRNAYFLMTFIVVRRPGPFYLRNENTCTRSILGYTMYTVPGRTKFPW